ncbi:uncharacterized protein LOC110598808 isoform X2 [Ictidomys tridecemlineatus]
MLPAPARGGRIYKRPAQLSPAPSLPVRSQSASLLPSRGTSAMLCKVLILLILCAVAGAFPSLRSELTTYGEVPGDQEQTTYPESTSDMNLDVMNISKFFVDLETATAIYDAEEASEAPDDYNIFQTMSFVGEDFDQNRTFPENNEYTSVYLYLFFLSLLDVSSCVLHGILPNE